MAKKVYIDVVVDDKGTTKKVAVDAKKLKESLKGVSESAQTADRRTKGAAQASSNASKNFSKMAQGINGGLVPAYATLAAQVFAVSAAFNFLRDAGDLQRLESGQLAYSSAVGVSMRSLTKDIVAATDAQLGFRDAAQAGAIGTAAGLTADQLTRLGKAANQTSQILGRDLTDSFNRLIRGVTKAEPELLDELGIILRLENATNKYKKALGIAGKLSSFQRTQAVTAEVLGQVEEKYAKILAITGEVPNEFSKLSAVFEGVVNDIKKFLAAGFTPMVNVLQAMPQLIIAAFLPFTVSILKAALPGLEDMSGSLEKVSASAKKGFEGAQKAQVKYQKDVDKLRGDSAVKARLKKEIQADGKAIKTMNKVRGNSLLARIQKGEMLDKNQIKRVEARLKKQEGSYKIKDKKILASLQMTLNKMKLYNDASSGAIESRVARTSAWIGTKYKQAEVVVRGAFAGMMTAATKFATVATTALSVLSWLSIIAVIGSLILSFVRSGKKIDEQIEKYDVLDEKLKVINEETNKYIEVQNVLYDSIESSNQALEAFSRNLSQVSSNLFAESLGQDYFSTLQSSIASAKAAAKAALPDLEAAAESTKQDAKNAFSRSGSQFAGLSEGVKAIQATADLNAARKDANMNLQEYLKTENDLEDHQVRAIQRLIDESDMIERHKNERFKNNKVTLEYKEILDAVIAGESDDIEKLMQKRNAMIELGTKVTALTQLQKELADTGASLEMNILPITEMDQYIDGLQRAKQEILGIEGTYDTMLPKQQKEIDNIQRRLKLARSVSELEFRVNQANLAIDQTSLKLSQGKTKLVKDEIKQLANIAKQETQIYQTEQKIAQAQYLLKGERDAFNAKLEKAGGIMTDALQIEQDTLNTREKAVAQLNAELGIMVLQKDELIAQRNELEEIRRIASQAFESNLESSLAALIKGTESSLKDAVIGIAKGVLESIADTLANQMTKKIMMKLTGEKSPEEKMATAITTSAEYGGDAIAQRMIDAADQVGINIANRIQAATGGSSVTPSASVVNNPATAPSDPTSAPGDPKKKVGFFERLFGKKVEKQVDGSEEVVGTSSFGTPVVKNPGTKREGGIFGPFLNSFSDIFDKNTEGGFLEKMGKSFMDLMGGFGDLFKGLPDLLGGLFGGAGGGGIGSIIGSLFGFRYGGIAKGYATGGIAKGRQAGYPAMLHGTEAVVPLPSGGKIPVEMKNGGGATTNNVSVNVTMSNDGNAKTESQSDGQQGADIGKLLANAVQEELHKQKRPGGILSPYGAA